MIQTAKPAATDTAALPRCWPRCRRSARFPSTPTCRRCREIGRVFDVSPLLVQQTLTAYLAPFALMTLWHGAISDALGRRRVTLTALALFLLASVGCALAWSIESLSCFGFCRA